MPRPSALTGITRYTVEYNDILYIIKNKKKKKREKERKREKNFSQ